MGMLPPPRPLSRPLSCHTNAPPTSPLVTALRPQSGGKTVDAAPGHSPHLCPGKLAPWNSKSHTRPIGSPFPPPVFPVPKAVEPITRHMALCNRKAAALSTTCHRPAMHHACPCVSVCLRSRLGMCVAEGL